jgi:hypothetical protein
MYFKISGTILYERTNKIFVIILKIYHYYKLLCKRMFNILCITMEYIEANT